MMKRGLFQDTRGEAGPSYLLTIVLVAIVGVAGFKTLGGSMQKGIANDSDGGGMAVAVQAGQGDAVAVDVSGEGDANTSAMLASDLAASTDGASNANIGGTSADAKHTGGHGKGGGGKGKNGGKQDCNWYNAICQAQNLMADMPKTGVLGKVSNFITNFGFNPVAWVADPWGQVQGSWNRVIGVGKFAWELGSGIVTLADTANTLWNPTYPGFWKDLITNGPQSFLDRRRGVTNEFLRIAPGVLKLGWRTSPAGLIWDAVAHPDEFMDHRMEDWNSIAHNKLTAGIVDPIAKCAGKAGSHGAAQACGKVAGDIILTVTTMGWGKGAKAAQLAKEAEAAAALAKTSEEAAIALRGVTESEAAWAKWADEIDEARRAERAAEAGKAGEADDAARAADEAAGTAARKLEPTESKLPKYELDEQGRPITRNDRTAVLEHDVDASLRARFDNVLASGDDAVRELLGIGKKQKAVDFLAETDEGFLLADAKAGQIGEHGLEQFKNVAQKLADEGHVTDPSQLDLRVIQQEGAKPVTLVPNGDLAPGLRAPGVADDVLVRAGTDDVATAAATVSVKIGGKTYEIPVSVERIESTASKYSPGR